jgi:hypothetical protein
LLVDSLYSVKRAFKFLYESPTDDEKAGEKAECYYHHHAGQDGIEEKQR